MAMQLFLVFFLYVKDDIVNDSRVITVQPLYQQESLSVLVGKIMEGVNRSLESTNREKFTQNVTKSKIALRKLY